MPKTQISADEFVWLFHERLREIRGTDKPVSLAIVPDTKIGWRLVLPRITLRNADIVAVIRKIESRLRSQYDLTTD